MTDARARLEAYLGIPLPDGMVEDARALAEAASARAHAAAAKLKEPREAEEFLAVLESLAGHGAGDRPEGDAGG